MPILKVRQTDNGWYSIADLTLEVLDLGNEVKLSSAILSDDKIKENENRLFVNNKKILNEEDKIKLENSIEINKSNIEAIEGKLTKFYEINSTNDGKLDLTNYLKENKKIHAFINFLATPDITYGTDKINQKGDTPEKGICEMDAYNYGGKFYIIWKNWGE